MTGNPWNVPPFLETSGNSGWPSGFRIGDSARAVVEDMMNTPLAGVRFAAMCTIIEMVASV
jgi:hypothetical protein